MVKDIAVGETITYYGYPIEKEEEGEYVLGIAADTLADAKLVIKRCLEAGILDWPIQTVGRQKKGEE